MDNVALQVKFKKKNELDQFLSEVLDKRVQLINCKGMRKIEQK